MAQKGVLGAYLFIIFTFTCQYDQLVGGCSGRLNKGGLRCGQTRKRGVLGAGQTQKRGVLGAGQVKKGVFNAAHTYTEHMGVLVGHFFLFWCVLALARGCFLD